MQLLNTHCVLLKTMKFWKQLGIFLLLELVMYVAAVCACEDFYIQRQHFNSRLIGYTTTYYSDIGFPDCATNCLLLPECRSLNYNFELSACELNTMNSSNNPQSNLSKEAAWVFSDAPVWPEEMAGTCAELPCGKNRMCLPTTPKFTCILDCGEFPVYPNAILEPVSATEKTFQCDEDAVKVYNSTITCSEDEDGNIVWQPKENTTLCKVVNQSRCENHGDCENNGGNCTGDNCVCQNGTCIARFILSPYEELGSSPDTGLLYIWHNDAYYGVKGPWEWWNWKSATAACQLIKPEYRFGGTTHLQMMQDKFLVFPECSDGTLRPTDCTFSLSYYSTNVQLGLTCYTSSVYERIRLSPVYGTGSYRRLEIVYNGVWGSICARWENFSNSFYEIACASVNKTKMLGGCSNSCAGGPGGPVLVRNIDCPEDVPHILFCHSVDWLTFGDEECKHYEVGLDCQ